VTERLYSADYIRMQHELALAQATRSGEPWVTVEVTDAAKGEVRAVTKVSVPVGHDLADVETYAKEVARLAVVAHESVTIRKGEAVA